MEMWKKKKKKGVLQNWRARASVCTDHPVIFLCSASLQNGFYQKKSYQLWEMFQAKDLSDWLR